MTMVSFSRFVCLSVLLVVASTNAFQPATSLQNRPSTTKLQDATGGWGQTNSRKMSDLEKNTKKEQRRDFEKYEAQERGLFMRQVREDRKEMLDQQKKELMEVAEFAGIDFKDPENDKFSVDLFMDEEDEDLDLSV